MINILKNFIEAREKATIQKILKLHSHLLDEETTKNLKSRL